MKATAETHYDAELKSLEVIAGPTTAARLGVPVGTVVRTVEFGSDGKTSDRGIQTEEHQ